MSGTVHVNMTDDHLCEILKQDGKILHMFCESCWLKLQGNGVWTASRFHNSAHFSAKQDVRVGHKVCSGCPKSGPRVKTAWLRNLELSKLSRLYKVNKFQATGRSGGVLKVSGLEGCRHRPDSLINYELIPHFW